MGRKKKDTEPKKTCSMCGWEKKLAEYYVSNNKMFTDGKSPVCKKCCAEKVDPYDIESVREMLKMLDKPFLSDNWNTCLARHGKTAWGNYMKQINGLHQYKYLTYKDSVNDGSIKIVPKDEEVNIEEEDTIKTETDKSIQITKDLKQKWQGYKNSDILKLEKFYDEMMTTHDIGTPQHKELLKLMCKLNLKMDKSLENDDSQGFSKYFTQYDKLMSSSGFRPIDKSAADDGRGIRTFSHIYEEIEKKGFIKPAPIKENQDIVDLTIMYILEYQLKLLSMQQLIEPPADTPKVDGDILDKTEEDLEVV